MIVAALVLFVSHRTQAQDSNQLRTDSPSPYVHRITLYDENGVAISPDDMPVEPYSPSRTCGKCHPVARIAKGWHFNADDPDAASGRRGAPWVLLDARTQTVIPVSARGWPGTFTPGSIGLTDWDFIKRFGGHMPGGPSEPKDNSIRWSISGAFETDCMVCHGADMQHDPAEASRQIQRENFRWSPTAALGLAVIRGEAKSMPDDWDPMLPPSPDYPEQNPPMVLYNPAAFDADDRVRFNVTRRPPTARCEFCHSVRDVSQEAPDRWAQQTDVHLRAGLGCTDCHGNDVGHQIVRGYDAEAAERSEPTVATYSCAGCHMGVTDAIDASDRLGGRYGAPKPEHRGMPPIHFERLTCTACHSGPWPRSQPRHVQTAMTHDLGIPDKHRREDDPPEIVEPIFAADETGRIAPHRMIWPAYFAWMEGDDISPLPLDVVERAAGRALPKSNGADGAEALPNGLVVALLSKIADRFKDRSGEPVRVADGYVHRIATGGEGAAALRVERVEHEVAEPYLWPLAHQVRPASQSLGVLGCDDCHSPDAPFFFGAVSLADKDRPIKAMFELQDVDEKLVRTWATSFRYRPAFKWFTFGAAGLILAILLIYGLRGFAAVLRRFG